MCGVSARFIRAVRVSGIGGEKRRIIWLSQVMELSDGWFDISCRWN
jgi:hypothetical protein